MEVKREKKSSIFYAANIIGYVRLALLLISVVCSKRLFLWFYGVSYILDAADGYIARKLQQESELGYILDMAVDRASTGVLILRIVKFYPRFYEVLSVFLVLDIASHMFCVVCRCTQKKSHKEHSTEGAAGRILSLYYSKPILFSVCFGAELFLVNLMYFQSRCIFVAAGAVFMFKQLTNVLQLYAAMGALAEIEEGAKKAK